MTSYRCAVLGSSMCGKTALTIQMTSNHFLQEHFALEDSYRKRLVVDGESCLLEILDTIGPSNPLRESWIQSSQAVIIVYSVTSRFSFDSVQQHVDAVKKLAGNEITIVVVGTKSDLHARRQVSTEEGEYFANQLGSQFFETSARFRTNVEESVFAAIREHRQRKRATPTATVRKPPKCLLQ